MRTLGIFPSKHTLSTSLLCIQMSSDENRMFGNSFDGDLDPKIEQIFRDVPKVRKDEEIELVPLSRFFQKRSPDMVKPTMRRS